MSKKLLLTTLQKGLEVLEAVPALAGSKTTTPSEIAGHIGMRRTSVYRYLDTLQEMGFVEQAGNGSEYRLAPRLIQIAADYLTDLDIRTQAEPVMAELVRQTGLTAHLVVLNRGAIVYVHKCDPDSPVQMRSRIGASAPAYCTAAGKAIMAHLPEEQLNEILSGDLPRKTANTITDPHVLRIHLAQVRERGFAVDNVENEEGIRCVGAPIFNFDGTVAGAVSITALQTELTEERVDFYASKVLEAAIKISRRMGRGY